MASAPRPRVPVGEPLHELRPPGPADLEGPVPHLHLGAFHPHDELWVHQVTGVAAQKAEGAQLPLHGGQHAGHLNHAVDQVVVEPVADDLHIHQLVRGDAAQPAGGVHGKAALLVHQVDVQRLFELQGKVIIAHRLEQEAHRVYLIALQGVLHQVGDKNDGHVFVVAAQLNGGVHPVFPGHLDIQKHHRVDGLVVLEKYFAVTKPDNVELLSGLGGVPLYVCRQMFGGGVFVFHDGDILHFASLLMSFPVSLPRAFGLSGAILSWSGPKGKGYGPRPAEIYGRTAEIRSLLFLSELIYNEGGGVAYDPDCHC